jgi:hypothetical protein
MIEYPYTLSRDRWRLKEVLCTELNDKTEELESLGKVEIEKLGILIIVGTNDVIDPPYPTDTVYGYMA